MIIESFPVGPLQCNCSIIACPETREAAVVDPGGDPEKILEYAKENNLTIKYLLHTHAHFDHIMGSRAVKEATGAKICINKGDQWLYDNLQKQVQMFGFKATDPLPVDHYLEHEEHVQVGNVKASVIHTPGHGMAEFGPALGVLLIAIFFPLVNMLSLGVTYGLCMGKWLNHGTIELRTLEVVKRRC